MENSGNLSEFEFQSMRAGSSFSSFHNFLDSQFDEKSSYEVIFKNSALCRIINKENLEAFIERPIFVNVEFNTHLSLVAAVQGRYSDAVLGQIYRLQVDTKSLGQVGNSDKTEKLVTFRKTEIIFKGRKSVMLNIRDISIGLTVNNSMKISKVLRTFESSLSRDALSQQIAIQKLCRMMLRNRELGRNHFCEKLKHFWCALKFTQFKAHNLTGMSYLQTSSHISL